MRATPDLDTTGASVGLRLAQLEPARFQVHVSPAQRAQLADPQSGEYQRGDHRFALYVSAARVHSLDIQLASDASRAAVASADVVFGCLDGDLARLVLTELCARTARPLFDLASDTEGLDTEHPHYGGRIVLANGRGCVLCRGELDQGDIARESEAETQREERERIYGVGPEALAGTGPMVVSMNGAVASLAITEFIALVTGLRAPVRYITFRGEMPLVTRSATDPEAGCIFCTGLWGAGV